MQDYFNVILPDSAIQAVSSVGLAHVGDAVYELLVRTWLCAHGTATGRNLHQAAIRLVCAEAQAQRAERIVPLLTPEEQAVFRRGRNVQTHMPPAHASHAQYAKATALEALFGWLYLRGQQTRINELFCIMMDDEA